MSCRYGLVTAKIALRCGAPRHTHDATQRTDGVPLHVPPQDVASACGVRAMPTFQAFVDGVKVEELTGADPQKLQAMAQMCAGCVG